MGVESANDVRTFLDADEHAVEALLVRATGEQSFVAGIFDAPVEEIDTNLGISVEQNDPTFITHRDAIGPFAKDDTLTIPADGSGTVPDGVYKIKSGLVPDAEGWFTLMLEAQE